MFHKPASPISRTAGPRTQHMGTLAHVADFLPKRGECKRCIPPTPSFQTWPGQPSHGPFQTLSSLPYDKDKAKQHAEDSSHRPGGVWVGPWISAPPHGKGSCPPIRSTHYGLTSFTNPHCDRSLVWFGFCYSSQCSPNPGPCH